MAETAIIQVLDQVEVMTDFVYNHLLTYRDIDKGRLLEVEIADISIVRNFAMKFGVEFAINTLQVDGTIEINVSMKDFLGVQVNEVFKESNGELIASSNDPERQYALMFVYKTKFK